MQYTQPHILLRSHLAATGTPKGKFAAELGISWDTLTAILKGARKPQPPIAMAIEAQTNGAVAFRSWWDEE